MYQDVTSSGKKCRVNKENCFVREIRIGRVNISKSFESDYDLDEILTPEDRPEGQMEDQSVTEDPRVIK